jgi:hypothetical protein
LECSSRVNVEVARHGEYGDIVNDTETVVTRAFVWVSLATVLKMYLPEVLDLEDEELEKTVTDVICVTLLVALVWSHRNLFRSVTATASSEVEEERGSERSRANSSLNTDDASNRIILDMMNSKSEMELIKLKKELRPLIPSMGLRERRRWEAMMQGEETRTGLMKYRSFRVMVRLAKILAAFLAVATVVALWIQVIYLAQKYPRVLDGLVVIDVIMVARFEWKLYRGKRIINPAVGEDGDVGAEGGVEEGEGIEMSSTNPLAEVEIDSDDSDDDDEDGEEMVKKANRNPLAEVEIDSDYDDEEMGKQPPPATTQRKKSIIRNPSARAGLGVHKLKKKFEGAEINEDGEKGELGKVVVRDGHMEARI